MGSSQRIASISEEVVSLLLIIGRFFRQQQWAHIIASVAMMGPYKCFGSNDGPIQVLWQHLRRISGPIPCHRWYFCQQQWAHARIPGAFQRKQQGHSGSLVELLVATMSPSQGIGSISQEKQLAFSSPSADSFSSNDRPMQVLQQHLRSSSEPIH